MMSGRDPASGHTACEHAPLDSSRHSERGVNVLVAYRPETRREMSRLRPWTQQIGFLSALMAQEAMENVTSEGDEVKKNLLKSVAAFCTR